MWKSALWWLRGHFLSFMDSLRKALMRVIQNSLCLLKSVLCSKADLSRCRFCIQSVVVGSFLESQMYSKKKKVSSACVLLVPSVCSARLRFVLSHSLIAIADRLPSLIIWSQKSGGKKL